MTESMVERVARAIADQSAAVVLREPGSSAEKLHWQDCINDAKAAIAAMRKSTGAMDKAGWPLACKDHRSLNEIKFIWQAMIDCALAEKPE